MQTFLPEPSFIESARVLDYRRLGKQRVEAKQILMALRGESNGWIHHPAVRMWRGYESTLAVYGNICCIEWLERGYKDSLRPYFRDLVTYYAPDFIYPKWFGDPAFHRAHQSNLLRKDAKYYRKFWPDVPNDLPYVWPVE